MAELTTIPPTLRPGVFIEEVKGPPASQPALPNRVLYVGHQLVGTAAPGENILLAGRHLAAGHFGAGAMLTDDKKFVPGLFVNQACSTSTTILNLAAKDIEMGVYEVAYGLMTDRCSNGPHSVWPDPLGPGGQPDREDWNMDNFGGTPRHPAAMMETAENVAKEVGITKEECDEVVLRRFEQFMEALADDRAFQKRYMFPPDVTVTKKKTKPVEEDEGWFSTTAEGLAKLKPIQPGGCLTFGAQTFPADGNCGIIVTTKDAITHNR